MPDNPAEYVIPEGPMVLQLRIANLLQVAAFPRPIDKGDLVRAFAIKEAVRLLGLTAHE